MLSYKQKESTLWRVVIPGVAFALLGILGLLMIVYSRLQELGGM